MPTKGLRLRRRHRRSGAGRWGLRSRLLISVGSFLIYLALRLLKWTTRWQLVDGDWLLDGPGREEAVIFAFWHEQLVMMPLLIGLRPGVCVMNSQHRDGEIITRAVERLGIEVVRGSSTRGWSRGLRGLLSAHLRGLDLVMVVDGPRGPRQVAKSGAIQLAAATGRRIVPLSYAPSRSLRLSSWDRLLVPLPLSRIVFVAGQAIEVESQASVEEKESVRAQLEKELARTSARARRIVRRLPLD